MRGVTPHATGTVSTVSGEKNSTSLQVEVQIGTDAEMLACLSHVRIFAGSRY